MPKITKFIVSASSSFNHPHEQYANFKPFVSLEAELADIALDRRNKVTHADLECARCEQNQNLDRTAAIGLLPSDCWKNNSETCWISRQPST